MGHFEVGNLEVGDDVVATRLTLLSVWCTGAQARSRVRFLLCLGVLCVCVCVCVCV